MSRKQKKSKPQQQARRDLSFKARWQTWYASKAPVFQFGLKFCALIILFYVLSPLPFCKQAVSAASTANARISSVMLNVLGEHTHVSGETISSAKYAMAVLPACSAFEYVWFFCAMVIAFPAGLARKVYGVLAGIILLLGLNLVRIASLFWVGVHFPRLFDSTHEEFWSIALIVAEVALCCAWISWARPYGNPEPDVVKA